MSTHQDNIPIFEISDQITHKRFFTRPDKPVFKNSTDALIFSFLAKNNSGKTREQICKELQLPRSSVFDSLNRMSITNLIETEFKIKSKSRKGRPSTIYFLKTLTQGGNR